MAAAKQEGTCSVCLRVMQLRNDIPIRHGFAAIGVRHGANSGYHTGPCAGASFPNLHISTEGTKAGLKIARERRDRADEELRRLATNPDLYWYPTDYNKRGRPLDLTRKVTLVHGVEDRLSAYHTDGRPSYAGQHKREVAEQQNRKDAAEQMIKRYEHVIDTWSPEKYPVKGAAPKLETVHLARSRTNPRFGTWEGITCRFTRPGLASMKPVKTTDITKVTCQKCKKSVGLP